MWNPHDHAHHHNITITYRHQTEPGLWWPTLQQITLRPGMTTAQERSVLAHELGHHHYADTGSTPKTEHRADKWAAQHLITVEQLAPIARSNPSHPEQWCVDLIVTPRMLVTWLTNSANLTTIEHLLRKEPQ